ncbi:MAG: prephenate dehydrogenase/arogenate dehydrogenase family protein [Clostridia bacterium]|nr:prephenate dehydrogenase/arogenate dehydrogenase family protein [Clostridia bacterium]NCC75383.1 prephenate dehydrogenase/arogenate dehydrogenase family protein [Clostridia bacterium]
MLTPDVPAENKVTVPMRVGVVGLGLIGGSLAKALAGRAKVSVVGIDPDPAVIEKALSDQILAQGGVMPLQAEPKRLDHQQASSIITAFNARSHMAESPTGLAGESTLSQDTVWQLLSGCQIVFLCTPPATIPDLVRQIRPFSQAILTDVASVKKPVLDLIPDDHFVGGHPMAGSEKHGYANARENLFENAAYVLCLPEQSAITVLEYRKLERLVQSIGASPISLDPQTHDKAVAAVSHLPHVAAAALSLLAARQGDNNLTRLAAGGFRDITRIASSDAGLWSQISLESSDQLLPLIDQYIAILQEFRTELSDGDLDHLRQYFFQAAQYRGSLPVDGRGALLTQSILNVYIPDEPGVIGKVTTLLGDHAINITNLRIREFRTYEGGSLQLLLPDSAQAARAAWLLKEAGYECD